MTVLFTRYNVLPICLQTLAFALRCFSVAHSVQFRHGSLRTIRKSRATDCMCCRLSILWHGNIQLYVHWDMLSISVLGKYCNNCHDQSLSLLQVLQVCRLLNKTNSDVFDNGPRQRNMDMRFGTWNMDNIKMDLLEIGLNVVDWIG
jgi:hypothetical protein